MSAVRTVVDLGKILESLRLQSYFAGRNKIKCFLALRML